MARKTKKATQKKTPRKKVTRKKVKRPTRRRKSPLKPEQIEHFREMLLAKYKEIIGDVDSMESEALKKSRLDAAGDLSSMPIHMADIGTDNYEQEFALELLDSERKLLREINDALQRIEVGRYGICEGTGKPIPKARLEATPWARYRVEYARMVEQGLVSAPEPTGEESEELVVEEEQAEQEKDLAEEAEEEHEEEIEDEEKT